MSAGRATPRRQILRYPEFVVWTAVTIGIPAWLVHLVFEAAMVDYTTAHPGWRWTMHLATALTAAATVAGIAICYDLRRAADRDDPAEGDDDVSPGSLSRFLGNLGLLVGVANLALILGEGSYVFLVTRHG